MSHPLLTYALTRVRDRDLYHRRRNRGVGGELPPQNIRHGGMAPDSDTRYRILTN